MLGELYARDAPPHGFLYWSRHWDLYLLQSYSEDMNAIYRITLAWCAFQLEVNSSWVASAFLTVWPQQEHSWVVPWGLTATVSKPAFSALLARIVRNWAQPASLIDFASFVLDLYFTRNIYFKNSLKWRLIKVALVFISYQLSVNIDMKSPLLLSGIHLTRSLNRYRRKASPPLS